MPQSADLCGRGQPDSRLERRIHKDHRLRASPVDVDQADSLKGQQRVPGGFRVGRRRKRDNGSAEVRGDGWRAEDGSGNPAAVEKGDEDQHEPHQRARQQRFRLPQGKGPGHFGGRRPGCFHPDLLAAPGEIVPVITAGQRRISDDGRRLGERQRLAAQCFGELHGAVPLGRIHAEPFGQAVQGLMDAEEPDGDDSRAAPGG